MVEFDDHGRRNIGLLFGLNAEKCINFYNDVTEKISSPHGYSWNSTETMNVANNNPKVLAHIELAKDLDDFEDAGKSLMAYFSKPHPYVPAVGDVVEFEYCGEMLKALVYESKMYELCTIDNTDRCKDGYHRKIKDYTFNYRKVGEVDVSGINHWDKARKIAKAYFSKPTFTGTYEERQKQWLKHHGLSYTSMVKVTRKAKDDEDGWKGYWSDKDFLVGNVYPIGFMSEITGISLHGGGNANDVPYFVLEPVA